MFKAEASFTSKQMVLVCMLFNIISACTTQTNTTTVTPELQQLRIANRGNADIVGLVVLFPGPTWDSEASRVEFGDIPAGQTSDYQNVPSGVYRYGGYEYTLNGYVVRQPAMDWVGEGPMAGTEFTYEIVLDPRKVEGDQVTLIAVLVDEP